MLSRTRLVLAVVLATIQTAAAQTAVLPAAAAQSPTTGQNWKSVRPVAAQSAAIRGAVIQSAAIQSAAKPAADAQPATANAKKPAVAAVVPPTSAPPASTTPAAPTTARERNALALVSRGNGTLPHNNGQVWREYDISPYTLRVTSTNRPEQAIVDWILRETGYEAWHSETVAVLSASKRTLRVYHTIEMQNVVSEVVDRFVNSQAESQTFGLRVVTVGNPNWRANMQRILKPIPVQSQGIQAWLLAKEDAALLLDYLRKRSDFREYTSPHLIVNNGQSTVVGTSRVRTYSKNVLLRPNTFPGFEIEAGQIDEGYSLEFNPLMSLDGRSIDAVVKANISQVEKMIPVTVDIPTQLTPHQRQRIEIPQMTSCSLHERFRWPADKVLLISRGVVATPMPKSKNLLAITLPGMATASRADALMFIQNKGKSTGAKGATPLTASRNGSQYRGRY